MSARIPDLSAFDLGRPGLADGSDPTVHGTPARPSIQ